MNNRPVLEFRINDSTEAEIRDHLFLCDQHFVPPLSERTDIHHYAKKLREYALTCEAWQQRLLVGLVAAYLNPTEGSCYISNVSVLSNHAGQGLATRLVKTLLTHVLTLNITRASLEVSAQCQPALRLYQKLGFQVVANRGDMCSMQRTAPPLSPFHP